MLLRDGFLKRKHTCAICGVGLELAHRIIATEIGHPLKRTADV
jgi:hypothetical protein